jgi:hypothetical protein
MLASADGALVGAVVAPPPEQAAKSSTALAATVTRDRWRMGSSPSVEVFSPSYAASDGSVSEAIV